MPWWSLFGKKPLLSLLDSYGVISHFLNKNSLVNYINLHRKIIFLISFWDLSTPCTHYTEIYTVKYSHMCLWLKEQHNFTVVCFILHSIYFNVYHVKTSYLEKCLRFFFNHCDASKNLLHRNEWIKITQALSME